MKITFIVLLLLFFSSLAVIVVGTLEQNDINRVMQSEIDGLRLKMIIDKRSYLKAVDSLVNLQTMQADSTKFYKSLKDKDQHTVTTKTESHEQILFVNLNDSARHSKITKFYASYVHP